MYKIIIFLTIGLFIIGCDWGNNKIDKMPLGKYYSRSEVKKNDYIEFINDSIYVHHINYKGFNYIDTSTWSFFDEHKVGLRSFTRYEYNQEFEEFDIRTEGTTMFTYQNGTLISGAEYLDYVCESVYREKYE